MKVYYKKSIVELIVEAQATARMNGKEIEYITLTKEELDQLEREVGTGGFSCFPRRRSVRKPCIMVMGVEIREAKEEEGDY